jgi:hypothetical protein
LAVIEEAALHVAVGRVYALVIELHDAARLLIDKLFPDLPQGP